MTLPQKTTVIIDEPEPGSDNLPATPAPPPEPTIEDDWGYETVEFCGDKLGVRRPTQQALIGFSLATSKYLSNERRNNFMGLFISQHLSPLSYDQVMYRLLDPDDPDYTVDTVGDLMKIIVELTTESTDAPKTSSNGDSPSR